MDIKRLLVLAGRPPLTEGSEPPWLKDKDEDKKDDKADKKSKLPWEKDDEDESEETVEESEEPVEEEWEKPWEKDDKDDEDDEPVEECSDAKPLEEDAPAGWEGTVKGMKKHRDIDNPYALSHYMKNKGYHSHLTKSGKKK